jgi:hypothetical protein
MKTPAIGSEPTMDIGTRQRTEKEDRQNPPYRRSRLLPIFMFSVSQKGFRILRTLGILPAKSAESELFVLEAHTCLEITRFSSGRLPISGVSSFTDTTACVVAGRGASGEFTAISLGGHLQQMRRLIFRSVHQKGSTDLNSGHIGEESLSGEEPQILQVGKRQSGIGPAWRAETNHRLAVPITQR